ncbi:MAG TPA: DUF3703 domain-containing protein [Nitrospiraceae bacterium]|nr:DUF3703 domain-containing protein [Nitrospiraceae bacterium]
MHAEQRQAYDSEMNAGTEHYYDNRPDKAFYHLERAHILGQSFTFAHAKAHWWMLKVGWKRRDPIEIRGQVARIIGALIFSRIWVPLGNTGGAHVSPFTSMPIPEEFQALLTKRRHS